MQKNTCQSETIKDTHLNLSKQYTHVLPQVGLHTHLAWDDDWLFWCDARREKSTSPTAYSFFYFYFCMQNTCSLFKSRQWEKEIKAIKMKTTSKVLDVCWRMSTVCCCNNVCLCVQLCVSLLSWYSVQPLSNCLFDRFVVSTVTKQREARHPNGNVSLLCVYVRRSVCVCVCMLCLCVRVCVSETETEDIIYSLSGRAIVWQEGLYCQLSQNNRIRDIPAEVCVCVCVCVCASFYLFLWLCAQIEIRARECIMPILSSQQ